MKPDEKQLHDALVEQSRLPWPKRTGIWRIADGLGIPYKRARYILRDKWNSRGWFEYGVSWRVGWLTPTGLEINPAEVGEKGLGPGTPTLNCFPISDVPLEVDPDLVFELGAPAADQRE